MGKSADLAGKRFGKLTVIERLNEHKGRYFCWKCNCDCGNQIIVSTKALNRGSIRDCGCSPRNNHSELKDITGRRFGKLQAKHRSEIKKDYWVCQCSCGNIIEVHAKELLNRRIKDCGCGSNLIIDNHLNLKGIMVGDVKILEPTEERDYKGSVMWKCKCSCGKVFSASADDLIHGNRRSCGCFKKKWCADFGDHRFLTFVDGTCVEWLKTRKSRSDNSSGFRGVHKTKKGTYRVSIGFKRKRYHLGTFSDYDKAVSVRLDAEKKIHDRFVHEYEQYIKWAKNQPEYASLHPFSFDVFVKDGEITVFSTYSVPESGYLPD